MLNVLLISPTQSGIGGIAQHIQGLSKFLTQHGHKTEIISSENTFTLPIKKLKNPTFALSASLKSAFKKYDIVHAHNLLSAIPMKRVKAKKVLTLHGSYAEQIELLYGDTMGEISKSFEKKALCWADAITAVSKSAVDYYKKLGFNVHHIPNAIDLDQIPHSGKRLYTKQVIFVGRLSKEKGVDILIDAFNMLRSDIHLLVIGDGPEKKNLEKQSQNKNVHFLGQVDHTKSLEYICASDILLQPSRKEGLSTTMLEAMACKIPIIATNVGGNADLIDNMKNGILVESENPKQMIDSIEKMSNDDNLKTELIENAYRKIINEYDWNKVVKSYINLYQKL